MDTEQRTCYTLAASTAAGRRRLSQLQAQLQAA
eukprot:COSAG02_NODE_47300_length_342_cov_0.831276_1_plen_32_part_01